MKGTFNSQVTSWPSRMHFFYSFCRNFLNSQAPDCMSTDTLFSDLEFLNLFFPWNYRAVILLALVLELSERKETILSGEKKFFFFKWVEQNVYISIWLHLLPWTTAWFEFLNSRTSFHRFTASIMYQYDWMPTENMSLLFFLFLHKWHFSHPDVEGTIPFAKFTHVVLEICKLECTHQLAFNSFVKSQREWRIALHFCWGVWLETGTWL